MTEYKAPLGNGHVRPIITYHPETGTYEFHASHAAAIQPGWPHDAPEYIWPDETPARPAWVTTATAIAAAVCIAIVAACAVRAGLFWSAGR